MPSAMTSVVASVNAAHNIARPIVIAPARPPSTVLQLVGFVPQSRGTTGYLTFNRCATLKEACDANQIVRIPYDLANSGHGLGRECNTQLVVSEVPKDMVLAVLYRVMPII
jgi:hypothetical protein